MASLSEKLKALGVTLGAENLPPPRPRNPYPIQVVVPGAFWETPHGQVFCFEKYYPLDHPHGQASLHIQASREIIAEWARAPQLAKCQLEGLAFLDTETTGLSGGTGTYAFLVGVGRYAGETFHLAQFFMRDPAEEPALLAALTDFLQPCRALVTFNGKAFDVPLLDTRYVANGAASALGAVDHLDLLPLARRLWRDRLPSRALGYLEAHILAVSRSQEDVPGRLIPSLYFDYLRGGDARPLKSVFYHNAMDVLSLAALLSHVAGLLESPIQGDVVHGLDLLAIGRLFEDLGYLGRAEQLYAQGLAYDLPEEAYGDAVRRLSFVHKRRGDLSAAVSWWQQAARDGHLYAHVELAKFYEHKAGDYGQALDWTQAAITLVKSSGWSRQARQRWLADLEHRLARLERKRQRSP